MELQTENATEGKTQFVQEEFHNLKKVVYNKQQCLLQVCERELLGQNSTESAGRISSVGLDSSEAHLNCFWSTR